MHSGFLQRCLSQINPARQSALSSHSTMQPVGRKKFCEKYEYHLKNCAKTVSFGVGNSFLHSTVDPQFQSHTDSTCNWIWFWDQSGFALAYRISLIIHSASSSGPTWRRLAWPRIRRRSGGGRRCCCGWGVRVGKAGVGTAIKAARTWKKRN